MSTLQVVPADMRDAASGARTAGEGARGHGSSGPLGTAGSAIPGAESVAFLTDLGTGWDEDVDAWAADVIAFADSVEAVGDDAESTDGGVGGLFGGLLGGLGGG